MKQLWYNTQTKVIYGSDESQAPFCEPITADKVPDLIANGATVDESANDVGNASGDITSSKPEESGVALTGTEFPNDSGSSTGTASDSNVNHDAPDALDPAAPAIKSGTADLPNDLASGAQDPSAGSTSGSAPAASGASVVAESPEDLAARHPGTVAEVSYSIPEAAGEPEKEAQRQADSAAIVGAGNMHLNSHVTDATGTTGTKDGQPVLSNATDG